MKKKAGVKILAVLLATSTILSGCGAQETSSRGTSSKEARSKEERSDEVITPSTSATGETSKDTDETAYAGSDAMSMSSSASVSSSAGSSGSGSTGEKTEYSLEDCPALTKLDWDAFNEACRDDGIGFYPDLFEWIGEDPRVDWAEVNECFDEYYGGSDGSKEFYYNMESSRYGGEKDERIGWVFSLYIEPYFTRTCNGEYEDLYDKLYNEAYADEIAEEEDVLKGYDSYSLMLAGEGMKKYGGDLDALAKYQASMIEGYLTSSYEMTFIEGTSVEVMLKTEYFGAMMTIDNDVHYAKPFINASGELDYKLKDYVRFVDLVQGYCGDEFDYASTVGVDMSEIRERAENQ